VTISCAETLAIEIRDNGRASDAEGSAPAWRPGVGLTSMRERATALGETWSAGPTTAGGRVLAELPLSLSGSAVPSPTDPPDEGGADTAKAEDETDARLAGSMG